MNVDNWFAFFTQCDRCCLLMRAATIHACHHSSLSHFLSSFSLALSPLSLSFTFAPLAASCAAGKRWATAGDGVGSESASAWIRRLRPLERRRRRMDPSPPTSQRAVAAGADGGCADPPSPHSGATPELGSGGRRWRRQRVEQPPPTSGGGGRGEEETEWRVSGLRWPEATRWR